MRRVVETAPLDVSELSPEAQQAYERARRTAFVSRFIVLRESKRSRAHRVLEQLQWSENTTAEELARQFRQVFVDNGDNMLPVDRDLRRAMAHADKSIRHFIKEYNDRSTSDFIGALYDYERSNDLLFGDEETEEPKQGGWRLPRDLECERRKVDA